jgi:hypothetical protein
MTTFHRNDRRNVGFMIECSEIFQTDAIGTGHETAVARRNYA